MIRIQYLDSYCLTRGETECAQILRFLQLLYNNRIEAERWTVLISQEIPLQTNGVDCGIFVCQMAERLSRNAPIDFTENDIPRFREPMALELASATMTSMVPTPQSEIIRLKQEVIRLRLERVHSQQEIALKTEALEKQLRENRAETYRLEKEMRELIRRHE